MQFPATTPFNSFKQLKSKIMSAYEGSKMQEMDEDRKRLGETKTSLPEHKKPINIPDGENDWWIGSETFTRQQVLKILYTQRAMISNDIKRVYDISKLPEEVRLILENPRTPNI